MTVDHFTSYTQACATRNKSAEQKLRNYLMISYFDLAYLIILHDQGGEFENKLFKELEKYLGVKHCWVTPYHLICNSMVERMDPTLQQISRKLEETCKSYGKMNLTN